MNRQSSICITSAFANQIRHSHSADHILNSITILLRFCLYQLEIVLVVHRQHAAQGIGAEVLDKGARYYVTIIKQKLLELVGVFTKKYKPEVLKNVDAQGVIADTSTMTFAWAGGIKEGEGHYYRIQTKEHLLEYDNVQNGARHVHAVWREFDGDFGEDLLRAHHHAHHNK